MVVDVSKLAIGTEILLETTSNVMLLRVMSPDDHLVAVESIIIDPWGCLGKLTTPVEKDKPLEIHFENCIFHSLPVVSASVSGRGGWYYDVF